MMDIDFIRNRLEAYRVSSVVEEDHAMREILQEYVLAALARTGFFTHAAFHGGTQLRIFHGLRRFSEDLDFALLAPDDAFALKPYLDVAAAELAALGFEVEIADKGKTDLPVRKAFVKEGSMVRLLGVHYQSPRGGRTSRKLQIKVEVDTLPPGGATTETRFLRFPFRVGVTNYDLPSAFAGKMHALLCRPYVKGRDWYDYDWFSGEGIKPNAELLANALNQMGPWAGAGVQIDELWIRRELLRTIATLDWKAAAGDVEAFLRHEDREILQYFNSEYFSKITEALLK